MARKAVTKPDCAESGLTQAELAAASGVSLKNISLIENDSRVDIKTDTAKRLAAALGCSWQWLLLGVGEMGDVEAPVSEPTPVPGRDAVDPTGTG